MDQAGREVEVATELEMPVLSGYALLLSALTSLLQSLQPMHGYGSYGQHLTAIPLWQRKRNSGCYDKTQSAFICRRRGKSAVLQEGELAPGNETLRYDLLSRRLSVQTGAPGASARLLSILLFQQGIPQTFTGSIGGVD